MAYMVLSLPGEFSSLVSILFQQGEISRAEEHRGGDLIQPGRAEKDTQRTRCMLKNKDSLGWIWGRDRSRDGRQIKKSLLARPRGLDLASVTRVYIGTCTPHTYTQVHV